SPIADVIPLRRQTKTLLTSAKDAASTYDDLVQHLLDVLPPEALRERLRDERKALDRVVMARKQPLRAARSDEKQVLTARAAQARWERWLATGRVRPTGPRRVTWSLQEALAGGERVVARRGRGLPP
ncbi:MAG: hypothetical protein WDA16_09530, partial [Candidatus Thermoplasmatota archaeon]